MNRRAFFAVPGAFRGVTLIELVIVVAVMAILLTIAMPAYRNYMLRVHRSEAIEMLLQAAMCQERLYANSGGYDTDHCRAVSGQRHYRLTYRSTASQGAGYIAVAIPRGPQLADPCGSLSLDQNGTRRISAADIEATKCWNGR